MDCSAREAILSKSSLLYVAWPLLAIIHNTAKITNGIDADQTGQSLNVLFLLADFFLVVAMWLDIAHGIERFLDLSQAIKGET